MNARYLVLCAALLSCGGPPEIVRSPSAACDAGACPVPDAGEKHAGSVPADPPDVIVTPPPQTDVGALLVVLRTAGGVEHAIMCAGEVSSESKGAPVACPYDGDAGRTLLKLDRGQP